MKGYLPYGHQKHVADSDPFADVPNTSWYLTSVFSKML